MMIHSTMGCRRNALHLLHPINLVSTPTAKTPQTFQTGVAKFGVARQVSALSLVSGRFHRFHFFYYMGISISEFVSGFIFLCMWRAVEIREECLVVILSCNFLVSFLALLGRRHGYLKVGRGLFLSRRRLLTGVCFISFTVQLCTMRSRVKRWLFVGRVFFWLGLVGFGLGVLGREKKSHIPVLDSRAFSFLFFI